MCAGPIPTEIGRLTAMQNLWLEENQLSGTPLIAHICRLVKKSVPLDANAYFLRTGPIPSEIGLLTAMEYFLARDNKLSGMCASPIELEVVNECTT